MFDKKITLYCGDSGEVMKSFPNNCIDLTVTSPPYDNLRIYNGFSFNFELIAQQLFRVTKQGGVVVWVVGDATIKGSETGTSFKQALYFKEMGFNLHDTMIYQKNNYVPLTHNRYEQSFEYMFCFSKGVPTTFNPIKIPCSTAGAIKTYSYDSGSSKEVKGAVRHNGAMDRQTITSDTKIKCNIWSYNVGKNQSTKDSIAFMHPAIFPEELSRDHIRSWSNENDVIFDPFAGSGTTLKMGLQLNRRVVGIELSQKYIDEIIIPRLKLVTNNEVK
jgi:DNA modification methylase